MKLSLIFALTFILSGFSVSSYAAGKTAKAGKTANTSNRPTVAPSLLSYQALMRLSPAKRMAYLNDIAKMMVKLEALQESGQLFADAETGTNNFEEFRAQVMNLISLFPDAHAQPVDLPVGKKKKVVPPANGVHADDEEISPPTFGSPDSAAADANPELEEVKPPPGKTNKQIYDRICPEVETPAACKDYTAGEKEAARKEMRDPEKYKKEERFCIFGGSFSKYKDNKVGPGRCLKQRSVARSTEPKKCKVNEGLCNPYLFCTQFVDPAKAKSVPVICLPIKSGDKVDLTARCDSLFNGDLAAINLKKCDGEGNTFPDLRDEWNEMRAKLSANYKNFCSREAFKVLNCNECGIMAKYLSEAAATATGSDCAENPEGPEKTDKMGYPVSTDPEDPSNKSSGNMNETPDTPASH